jgi:uncharacterized damage-inducible protein DinB
MTIGVSFSKEFAHECASTRRTLDRMPGAKMAWKPHAKSMSMSRLAGHLAEIPALGLAILNSDVYDLAAGEHKHAEPGSVADALALFDKNVAAFQAALKRQTDRHMKMPWKLVMGEKVILELPRTVVVRTIVISHSVHHRAQLGVYLRLNDVPVPAVYGPSADEPMPADNQPHDG